MTYGYTNDDQLTSVSHANGSFASESFSYDANGNRNASGYSTGTGNRLTGDGTYTYTYDDEGNRTSRTETATGNRDDYTWDHRNRLIAVDHVVGGTSTRVGTYVYDALDLRLEVVENGATRATLYDGVSALLDFNGSGTQVARYLQGPVIDELLARETSGGTVAWYLQDRLNTVRDLVDSSGAVIDHVDYGVFGNVQSESSPTSGDRWKFTGRELDATDLYQFRSRSYDAWAGRFISEDRIGFAGGDADLYRYLNNNSIAGVDWSGFQARPSVGSAGVVPPRKPSPPSTEHGIFDYYYPGYLQVDPGFRPNPGDKWYWVPEYDDPDPKKPFSLPAPNTTGNYADFLQSPAGVLKIEGGTTVRLVKCTSDGRPIFTSNGPTYWFPANGSPDSVPGLGVPPGALPGGANPAGDNPATPGVESWPRPGIGSDGWKLEPQPKPLPPPPKKPAPFVPPAPVY